MKRLFRALVALACCTAALAFAQEYPARPVRVVVPFAAGGPADVYARFLAQRLQESLGQPFVVDDRPGGGSVVGTDFVAKSAPDGYTLLLMSNTHTVNESLMTGKPFQLMRDFVAVAPINYSDLVLVRQSVGAGEHAAGADRAGEGAAGQAQLRVVGTGHAVSHGRRAVQVDGRRRHRARAVQGQLRARTDVLGGQVEMMFDAVTTMSEHVKAGKVKALATSGTRALGGDARTCRRSPKPACPATTR